MKIGIISATSSGDKIGEKILENFQGHLYSKSTIKKLGIKVIAKECMEQFNAVIFVSSTGIAVRAIAEYIKSKDVDPAVLVIDNCANFVISLLSGHLGGANELTLDISKILGSQPVITTATDNLKVCAPDLLAKKNGLIIDNLKDAKQVAALLVDGKNVAFIDEENIMKIPSGYIEDIKKAEALVWVTNKVNGDFEIPYLKLIRKNLILGIGCRKNFDEDKMKLYVKQFLIENNLDQRAVKAIVTVEVKKDEKAIIDLAHELECGIKIFSIEDIKGVQHKFEGSAFVEKTIGVTSVCEPCVDLFGAKILKNKVKLHGMTLCVGEVNI